MDARGGFGSDGSGNNCDGGSGDEHSGSGWILVKSVISRAIAFSAGVCRQTLVVVVVVATASWLGKVSRSRGVDGKLSICTASRIKSEYAPVC